MRKFLRILGKILGGVVVVATVIVGVIFTLLAVTDLVEPIDEENYY